MYMLFFSGRLQEGDQLIEVNGQNLERVTNEEYVEFSYYICIIHFTFD